MFENGSNNHVLEYKHMLYALYLLSSSVTRLFKRGPHVVYKHFVVTLLQSQPILRDVSISYKFFFPIL